MNNEQLKALEQSISHWDRICHGLETISEGCDCCVKYANLGCVGCPVGNVYFADCSETSYYKFRKACFPMYDLAHNHKIFYMEDNLKGFYLAVDLAEAMLLELIKLLPPKHAWKEQL